MGYLGAFNLGTDVTLRVAWVPQTGDTITDAAVTVVHEDGTEISTPGVPDGVNTFKARVVPNKGGNWQVRWLTVPVGGSTEDWFYVEP